MPVRFAVEFLGGLHGAVRRGRPAGREAPREADGDGDRLRVTEGVTVMMKHHFSITCLCSCCCCFKEGNRGVVLLHHCDAFRNSLG